MPEINSGTVNLSFSVPQNSKTSAPDIDIIPERYIVTCTGPQGISREIVVRNTRVTIEGLLYGEWAFRVEAYNAAGILLARGEETCTIEAGKTVNLELTAQPLYGPGSIVINVIWEAGCEAEINATLRSSTGSQIPVVLNSPSTSGQESAKIDEIQAGYYTLDISFDNHCELPAGAMDMVWVFAGQQTDVNINFQRLDGKAEITITPEIPKPIEITMLGFKNHPGINESMIVTADIPAEFNNVSYAWYINNQLVSTEKTVEIKMDHTGNYLLSVIVSTKDGRQGGSARAQFLVGEYGNLGYWDSGRFDRNVFAD